jgi:O-antigen/teichoic acid export membrane protein
MPMATETALHPPKRSAGFVVRSLFTTGTRLLDLPSRYGLHLLVAKKLAVADVGAFYIVFSVMTLAAGFGRIGIDRALTREVAAALGRDQPELVRKAVRRAFLVTAGQSLSIAVLLALTAIPIANDVLKKPGLGLMLILGALTIVPQNLSTTAAGALAGMGRIATSQMIYSWLWPALFCLGALVMPLTVPRVLWLIFASLLIDAAVGIVLMWRALPESVPSAKTLALPPYFRVAISFFSLELTQLAIASLPAFVLGIFASEVQVGRYALAWRIVLILNILVSAIAAMASPQFARASAQEDHAALARVGKQAVGLTAALSCVPIVLLAVAPTFFLGFFGRGYDAAAPVLRILLAGQTALVLCAAMPELLGMSGRARSLFKINVACVVVLTALLAAFTPHFKDVGAATAVAVTMAFNAIAVTVAVRRYLGFIPVLSLAGTLGGSVRSSAPNP